MDLQIEWRGCRDSAQTRLERLVRDSLTDFFRHKPIEAAHVIAYKAERGGDGNQIIKVLGTPSKHPECVPVCIHLEGTLGLYADFRIPGRKLKEATKLIAGGPYKIKPRRPAEAAAQPAQPSAASEATPELSVPDADLPAASSVEPASAKPAEAPPRLTPREKLREAGESDDNIARLEATLASIIHREFLGQNLAEIPNTLRVRVKDITAAIMDHMQLPRNLAGTYKGIVGSFYSSRIALFALKYESSLDPDDQYTDWLFDCDLVVDFVGGKDRLAVLAREREIEVRERIEREATELPPPPAVDIERAVTDNTVSWPDASILELALKTLEGRKAAEADIERALLNETQLAQAIAELEARMEDMNRQLETAKLLTAEARAKRETFVISPEVLEKVRQAKARLDALARDLGV